MFYAQLNEENICVGVSQLSGEIDVHNMIKLENYDSTILGKKYEKGVWIDLPKLPPKPSQEEIIMAQTLLNQANIQNQLKSINEFNEKILLERKGKL